MVHVVVQEKEGSFRTEGHAAESKTLTVSLCVCLDFCADHQWTAPV